MNYRSFTLCLPECVLGGITLLQVYRLKFNLILKESNLMQKIV